MCYKRSASLCDTLIHSHFSGTSSWNPCGWLPKGTFKCGFCEICHYISNVNTFRLPNGRLFSPQYYVNCTTEGVVYLLKCGCGDFYVGKTMRPFARCIYEHMGDIKAGTLDTPMERHLGDKPGYKDINLTFTALDHVHPNPRGGNTDCQILKLEAKWIFILDATKPTGLNDHISFKSFL